MSLFKCKMCGGDLEIAEGVTIAECEYCGTKQTVPKAIDENLQNLFNRANTLRIKSEFDKAEKLYEKNHSGRHNTIGGILGTYPLQVRNRVC